MEYSHQQYYINNKRYTEYIDKHDLESYKKYTDYIIKFTKPGNKLLDVGCGTGKALKLLKQISSDRNTYGLDISNLSIEKCKENGLNCLVYDGRKVPFADKHFDLVGSYNVLEHTDYPETFLDESLRVTKTDGYLIVVCPNFLSITNSYHHHTRGLLRKIKNLYIILKKSVFQNNANFQKMKPITNDEITPDNDACNVTNPIDLRKWVIKNNLKVCYWSSRPDYSKSLANKLDFSILRLFLGSSFMVLKRTF